MTKKDFMDVAWVFALLALFAIVCFVGGLYVRTSLIKRQQAQIDYLNQTIGEYKNNEDWFEDYIEILEETYERGSEIKVLEERIYWLNKYKETSEFNKEYADQMYSDFYVFIREMFDYVKVNGNLDNFDEYFRLNHSEVYNRIDKIYEDNH